MVVGGGQHGLPVRLGDEGGGNLKRRQAHDAERVARDVVVDEDRRGLERGQVVDLLLEGHLTARDENNLPVQALRVLRAQGCDVFPSTEPTVDVFVVAGGHLGDLRNLPSALSTRTLVGDILTGRGEGVDGQEVVERGHGQRGAVRGGLTQGRGVGVGGVGQVLTGGVAVSGGEGVTGGHVDDDALVLQRLEDARVEAVGRVIHAGVLAERQVHDVGVQDRHVVEGGQQRGVQHAAAVLFDLRDDDLRVGGHAHDLAGVGRGDAGDVRPVRLQGRGVVILVRVVVGEGELLVDVDAVLAPTQLGCEGSHLVRRERGRPRQGAREGGVRHVDARVDDGDDLTLPPLGHLVGVHDDLGAEVVGVLVGQTRSLEATLSVDSRHVADVGLTVDERTLNAAGRADRVKRAGGGLERDTREGV